MRDNISLQLEIIYKIGFVGKVRLGIDKHNITGIQFERGQHKAQPFLWTYFKTDPLFPRIKPTTTNYEKKEMVQNWFGILNVSI